MPPRHNPVSKAHRNSSCSGELVEAGNLEMIQPFDTISDLDTATENQVEAHPPRQSTAKRKLKEPSAPPRKKQAALMATNIVPATAGSSITEINLEPYNLLTVTISDGTGPAPLPSPENGTRYRLLPEDDPTTLAWLAFLGNAFTTVGHPPMTLVNFPDGYALYEETKVDASGDEIPPSFLVFLYGHPGGEGKRFGSRERFLPHLKWISAGMKKGKARCMCVSCSEYFFGESGKGS